MFIRQVDVYGAAETTQLARLVTASRATNVANTQHERSPLSKLARQ
jgi:hypothetical protein